MFPDIIETGADKMASSTHLAITDSFIEALKGRIS
jgi:hypothetical protein